MKSELVFLSRFTPIGALYDAEGAKDDRPRGVEAEAVDKRAAPAFGDIFDSSRRTTSVRADERATKASVE